MKGKNKEDIICNPYYFLFVCLIIQPFNGYLFSKVSPFFPIFLIFLQVGYLFNIAFNKIKW